MYRYLTALLPKIPNPIDQKFGLNQTHRLHGENGLLNIIADLAADAVVDNQTHGAQEHVKELWNSSRKTANEFTYPDRGSSLILYTGPV